MTDVAKEDIWAAAADDFPMKQDCALSTPDGEIFVPHDFAIRDYIGVALNISGKSHTFSRDLPYTIQKW